MSRPVAILAALLFVAGVAAYSFISSGPLTDREWSLCQTHWRDGLDASQRDGPNPGTWFFNHMADRKNPDTIRVCRTAASKH